MNLRKSFRAAESNVGRAMVGLVIMGCAIAPAVSVAQVTLVPDTIDLTLAPGETFTETKTVTIPGGGAPVDIYFLADTTGSMGQVIGQVQTDAAAILASLQGTLADVQFGVGEYKDFPFDAYAFRNNTPMTADDTAVLAGINLWAAGGGADGSEGQFFALDQIADPGDPFAIGFRENAHKILVWFGDAPGHDPVCAAISGLGADITEASLIQKLTDGRFTVIAISVDGGFDLGLNDDPALSAGDYDPPCTIGGTAGQGDRISAATGGTSLTEVPANEITDAIIAAIEGIVTLIDVALVPDGDTAAFTQVLTPPYLDQPLPEEGEELVLEFEVEFTGPPCGVNENLVLEGVVNATVDNSVAASQAVTLRQSGCANVAPACGLGEAAQSIVCDGTAQTVALSAEASDENGDSLTYAWSSDCPGASFDDANSATPMMTLTAPEGCTDGDPVCTVTLTVSDGTETSTCTLTIFGSAAQATSQPASQPVPDCGIGLCGFGTFGMMPVMVLGLGLTRQAFRRRR